MFPLQQHLQLPGVQHREIFVVRVHQHTHFPCLLSQAIDSGRPFRQLLMAIEISGPLLNRDLGSIDTLRVKLLLEEGASEILGKSTVSW